MSHNKLFYDINDIYEDLRWEYGSVFVLVIFWYMISINDNQESNTNSWDQDKAIPLTTSLKVSST